MNVGYKRVHLILHMCDIWMISCTLTYINYNGKNLNLIEEQRMGGRTFFEKSRALVGEMEAMMDG